jgi:hypothetical protein
MNIAKLKEQTKRQIDYVDRILSEPKVNINPIMGTSRERDLKMLVDHHKKVIERFESI